MKKLIPIILLVMAIVGCTSPEKKAAATIDKYLKTQPIDLSNYETLATLVDTAYNLVIYNKEFKELYRKAEGFQREAEFALIELNGNISLRDIWEDSRYSYGRKDYEKYDAKVKTSAEEYVKQMTKYLDALEKIYTIVDNTNEKEVLGWMATRNAKQDGTVYQTFFLLSPDYKTVLGVFNDELDLTPMKDFLEGVLEHRDEVPHMRAELEKYTNMK